MTGEETTGDREPRQCAACGTVNPWMNEVCRACGGDLAAPAGEEPETPGAAGPDRERPGAPPGRVASAPRRIAIRWVLGGGGLFLLVYGLLQLALMGIIAADDNPDLAPLKNEIDRTMGRERVASPPLDQLDEQQKARVRDALMANSVFVAGVFAMLLLPPFFGGLVVGRFSGSLLEAAAACGVGAFVGGTFIEGDVFIGLVFLAVMAPMGIPAALLGRYWRARGLARGTR